MRGGLTWTWAQVITAVRRIGSRATGLVLGLRRDLAGLANEGFDSPPAHLPNVEVRVVMHAGVGTPPDCIGEEGHYFCDDVNMRVYGPRTSEGWPMQYVSVLPHAEFSYQGWSRSMVRQAAEQMIKDDR